MKIIFDFDGTLTCIRHEYDFELNYFCEHFRSRFGIQREAFEELYDAAHSAVLAEPHAHGWSYDGRISAYCDEDPFMTAASVMTLLDRWKDNPPERFAPILKKIHGTTFLEVAEDAHAAMRRQPLVPMNTPDPGTVSVINNLIERGHEVVVVSNSTTDVILRKFEYTGVRPVDHENDPRARFRVRGNALKYQLDAQPELVDFGPRTIDVARGFYRRIIHEERPRIIVGDVFSLDLALPIRMSCIEPEAYKDLQLFLRVRPYTPRWALECMTNPLPGTPARLNILERPEDLPDRMRDG